MSAAAKCSFTQCTVSGEYPSDHRAVLRVQMCEKHQTYEKHHSYEKHQTYEKPIRDSDPSERSSRGDFFGPLSIHFRANIPRF